MNRSLQLSDSLTSAFGWGQRPVDKADLLILSPTSASATSLPTPQSWGPRSPIRQAAINKLLTPEPCSGPDGSPAAEERRRSEEHLDPSDWFDYSVFGPLEHAPSAPASPSGRAIHSEPLHQRFRTPIHLGLPSAWSRPATSAAAVAAPAVYRSARDGGMLPTPGFRRSFTEDLHSTSLTAPHSLAGGSNGNRRGSTGYDTGSTSPSTSVGSTSPLAAAASTAAFALSPPPSSGSWLAVRPAFTTSDPKNRTLGISPCVCPAIDAAADVASHQRVVTRQAQRKRQLEAAARALMSAEERAAQEFEALLEQNHVLMMAQIEEVTSLGEESAATSSSSPTRRRASQKLSTRSDSQQGGVEGMTPTAQQHLQHQQRMQDVYQPHLPNQQYMEQYDASGSGGDPMRRSMSLAPLSRSPTGASADGWARGSYNAGDSPLGMSRFAMGNGSSAGGSRRFAGGAELAGDGSSSRRWRPEGGESARLAWAAGSAGGSSGRHLGSGSGRFLPPGANPAMDSDSATMQLGLYDAGTAMHSYLSAAAAAAATSVDDMDLYEAVHTTLMGQYGHRPVTARDMNGHRLTVSRGGPPPLDIPYVPYGGDEPPQRRRKSAAAAATGSQEVKDPLLHLSKSDAALPGARKAAAHKAAAAAAGGGGGGDSKAGAATSPSFRPVPISVPLSPTSSNSLPPSPNSRPGKVALDPVRSLSPATSPSTSPAGKPGAAANGTPASRLSPSRQLPLLGVTSPTGGPASSSAVRASDVAGLSDDTLPKGISSSLPSPSRPSDPSPLSGRPIWGKPQLPPSHARSHAVDVSPGRQARREDGARSRHGPPTAIATATTGTTGTGGGAAAAALLNGSSCRLGSTGPLPAVATPMRIDSTAAAASHQSSLQRKLSGVTRPSSQQQQRQQQGPKPVEARVASAHQRADPQRHSIDFAEATTAPSRDSQTVFPTPTSPTSSTSSSDSQAQPSDQRGSAERGADDSRGSPRAASPTSAGEDQQWAVPADAPDNDSGDAYTRLADDVAVPQLGADWESGEERTAAQAPRPASARPASAKARPAASRCSSASAAARSSSSSVSSSSSPSRSPSRQPSNGRPGSAMLMTGNGGDGCGADGDVVENGRPLRQGSVGELFATDDSVRAADGAGGDDVDHIDRTDNRGAVVQAGDDEASKLPTQDEGFTGFNPGSVPRSAGGGNGEGPVVDMVVNTDDTATSSRLSVAPAAAAAALPPPGRQRAQPAPALMMPSSQQGPQQLSVPPAVLLGTSSRVVRPPSRLRNSTSGGDRASTAPPLELGSAAPGGRPASASPALTHSSSSLHGSQGFAAGKFSDGEGDAGGGGGHADARLQEEVAQELAGGRGAGAEASFSNFGQAGGDSAGGMHSSDMEGDAAGSFASVATATVDFAHAVGAIGDVAVVAGSDASDGRQPPHDATMSSVTGIPADAGASSLAAVVQPGEAEASSAPQAPVQTSGIGYTVVTSLQAPEVLTDAELGADANQAALERLREVELRGVQQYGRATERAGVLAARALRKGQASAVVGDGAIPDGGNTGLSVRVVTKAAKRGSPQSSPDVSPERLHPQTQPHVPAKSPLRTESPPKTLLPKKAPPKGTVAAQATQTVQKVLQSGPADMQDIWA